MKGKQGFQKGHGYLKKPGFKHSEASIEKMKLAHKGQLSWNTGLKGVMPSGDKSPSWKGGLPKCSDCTKQVSVRKYTRCHACNSRFMVGEKNPNWIVDRTKLQRNTDKLKNRDSAYSSWRAGVYKRDNFRCKIATGNCTGKIEAHHILRWVDYPELRYEVNNGITLCHAHHPRKRSEEVRLSPYFKELVIKTN